MQINNKPLVSICIPCYNQWHLIRSALYSIDAQNYENIEVIILDDASTCKLIKPPTCQRFDTKIYYSEEQSGSGGSFNKAIEKANGEIIFLLCSDDYITNKNVISDVVRVFNSSHAIAHVSRYYYQFIDGKEYPVRAWHNNNIIELANNPSGLAFRKSFLKDHKLTNAMFVESSTLVYKILKDGWDYYILPYDTVAVRIHQSISQTSGYYFKMWKSSPIEEWVKIGGKELLKDYTSLVQIKNNFKVSAVIKECFNFVKYRPISIIHPYFWFYAIVAIFTPRKILRILPHIYRITIGRLTTRIIKRNET